MSLLQHPVRALDQIDWYLENSALEKFPHAFELAAGNLSRQLLEQVLFILAFYGDLPAHRYLRRDRRLQTAGRILDALLSRGPAGEDYVRTAAARGSRIKKFARLRRRLRRWLRLLNEPSHYRNPAARRTLTREELSAFSHAMRQVFDENDSYLLIGAVNEIGSRGRVRAELGPEPGCYPHVVGKAVVRIRNLALINGTLGFTAPSMPLRVVPADREVSLRRWSMMLVVQHSKVPDLRIQMVTERGQPIDLSSLSATLMSIAPTKELQRKLHRRLRRIGCRISEDGHEWTIELPAATAPDTGAA